MIQRNTYLYFVITVLLVVGLAWTSTVFQYERNIQNSQDKNDILNNYTINLSYFHPQFNSMDDSNNNETGISIADDHSYVSTSPNSASNDDDPSQHQSNLNNVSTSKSSSSSSGSTSINQYWTPLSFPNPSIDPVGCHLPVLNQTQNNGQIPIKLCDPNGLLGGSDVNNTKSLRLINALSNFRRWSSVICDDESNVATVYYDHDRNVSGNYSSKINGPNGDTPDNERINVEVAVAIVRKMDVRSILSIARYYEFEDIDDAVNEAARYFATYLRNSWRVGDANNCGSSGILVFISADDRVCYISTGSAVSDVLTDWRLQDAIGDARPFLRRGQYLWSIEQMLSDFEDDIVLGPPCLKEKSQDFVRRYGLVTLLAASMFLFGVWSESNERYNKRQIFDLKSLMSPPELHKARMLQKGFDDKYCPICLNGFKQPTGNKNDFCDSSTYNDDCSIESELVASIPTIGSDGKPIKLLRCGHTFDQTCWKHWINSGRGDISKCPICRQDVARTSRLYRFFSDSSLHRTPRFENESASLLGANNASQQIIYGTGDNYDLNRWMMETDI